MATDSGLLKKKYLWAREMAQHGKGTFIQT